MTPKTELRAKLKTLAKEKRELAIKIGGFSVATDALTAEQETECREAQQRVHQVDIEIDRAQTAFDALPEDRSETRPRDTERALMDRFSVARAVADALGNKSPGDPGPNREVREELGIAENMVPYAAIGHGDYERGEPEHRAVSAIAADQHVGGARGGFYFPAFARSLARYLRVRQPTIRSGDGDYVGFTGRPAVSGPSVLSDEYAAPAVAVAVNNLEPGRGSVSLEVRRVDLIRVGPGAETSIRSFVGDATSEWLDQQIVNQIVSDVARTDAAAADTYDTVLSRFVYAGIEGRYAASEDDIRMVLGNDTLADWASLKTQEVSAADKVRSLTGGTRVSPLIAATAANKRDVIIRKGLGEDMVQPLWDALEIVTDRQTLVTKGEVRITALSFSAVKVLRTGGFGRVQAQHS